MSSEDKGKTRVPPDLPHLLASDDPPRTLPPLTEQARQPDQRQQHQPPPYYQTGARFGAAGHGPVQLGESAYSPSGIQLPPLAFMTDTRLSEPRGSQHDGQRQQPQSHSPTWRPHPLPATPTTGSFLPPVRLMMEGVREDFGPQQRHHNSVGEVPYYDGGPRPSPSGGPSPQLGYHGFHGHSGRRAPAPEPARHSHDREPSLSGNHLRLGLPEPTQEHARHLSALPREYDHHPSVSSPTPTTPAGHPNNQHTGPAAPGAPQFGPLPYNPAPAPPPPMTRQAYESRPEPMAPLAAWSPGFRPDPPPPRMTAPVPETLPEPGGGGAPQAGWWSRFPPNPPPQPQSDAPATAAQPDPGMTSAPPSASRGVSSKKRKASPTRGGRSTPRMRSPIACWYCRKRKIRCSRSEPSEVLPGTIPLVRKCDNCIANKKDCYFEPASDGGPARAKFVLAGYDDELSPAGKQLFGPFGEPIRSAPRPSPPPGVYHQSFAPQHPPQNFPPPHRDAPGPDPQGYSSYQPPHHHQQPPPQYQPSPPPPYSQQQQQQHPVHDRHEQHRQREQQQRQQQEQQSYRPRQHEQPHASAPPESAVPPAPPPPPPPPPPRVAA